MQEETQDNDPYQTIRRCGNLECYDDEDIQHDDLKLKPDRSLLIRARNSQTAAWDLPRINLAEIREAFRQLGGSNTAMVPAWNSHLQHYPESYRVR